jgi:hypothetical protein
MYLRCTLKKLYINLKETQNLFLLPFKICKHEDYL